MSFVILRRLMTSRRAYLFLSIFLALAPVYSATCGGSASCSCGDIVVADYTMTSDLGPCTGHGLYVAEGVTLDGNGYFLYGSGGTIEGYGVYIRNASGATVKNVKVTGFRRGIRLRDAHGNQILNNESFQNGTNGVGYGIDVALASSNNVFKGNSVHDNADEGVHMGSGSENTFYANEFYNNAKENIYLLNSDDNIFTSNVTWGGQNSIFVKDSSFNLFENNTFQDARAVIRADSHDNELVDNNFDHAGLRIEVYTKENPYRHPYGNHISDGTISNTKTCIEFLSSWNNVITDTTFNNCGTDVDANSNLATSVNTLIGVRFNPDNMSLAGNALVEVGWQLDVHVEDESGHSVSGATVSAFDVAGNLVFEAPTNSTGNIPRQNVIQYTQSNSSQTFHTPIRIETRKTAYDTATRDISLIGNTAITVVLQSSNSPPNANAGPDQTTTVGETVTLDGSSSTDPEEDALAYSWDFGDSTVNLGNAAVVNHTYNTPGTYTVTLSVSDGALTNTDNMLVTVNSLPDVNAPPVADAGGDRLIIVGETVTFDGSKSSDPNADPLTYFWDLGNGTQINGETITYSYSSTGTYAVALTVSDGNTADSDTAIITVSPAAQAEALFLGKDLDTAGHWSETYGSEGFVLTNYSGNTEDIANLPPYVDSYSYRGARTWVWSGNTSDARALIPLSGDRVAATAFADSSFSLTLRVNDTASHTVALYFVDWDTNSRQQTVTIFDANSSIQLDQRSIENFHGGLYLQYQVRGDIRIEFTHIAGWNAVLSGVFWGGSIFPSISNNAPVPDAGPDHTVSLGAQVILDGSGSNDADGDPLTYSWDFGDGARASGKVVSHTYVDPGNYNVTLAVSDGEFVTTDTAVVIIRPDTIAQVHFLGEDSTSQGAWNGHYGADGFVLFGYQEKGEHLESVPPYIESYFLSGGARTWVWAPDSADSRALLSPTGEARSAGTLYSPSTFSVTLTATDDRLHSLAFYLLDWDTTTREQLITIFDAESNVELDRRSIANFHEGVYIRYQIRGSIRVEFTRTGGLNAVVAAMFWGEGLATEALASFVGEDNITQGDWQGTYGSEGFLLVNYKGSGQDFVNLSPYISTYFYSANSRFWVWSSDTADSRALASPLQGRAAATTYNDRGFSITLIANDDVLHSVTFYFVDWDSTYREQTITIFDELTNVQLDQRSLADFSHGVYFKYEIRGTVRIEFKRTAGYNAVLSGVFWD